MLSRTGLIDFTQQYILFFAIITNCIAQIKRFSTGSHAMILCIFPSNGNYFRGMGAYYDIVFRRPFFVQDDEIVQGNE